MLAVLLIVAGALLPASAAGHSAAAAHGSWPAPGIADVPPVPLAVPHAQPSASYLPGLLLVLAAGLLAGAAGLAPRRALVVSLSLLLGSMALEEGVHSVHHLGAPDAAACVVAAAAGNLVAALHGGAPVLPEPDLVVRVAPELGSIRPHGVSLGPVPARAPPVPIA